MNRMIVGSGIVTVAIVATATLLLPNLASTQSLPPPSSVRVVETTYTPIGVAAVGSAATRREFAAYAETHGMPSARVVAVAADAATFGPSDPDGAAASQVWQLVGAVRYGATAMLPRWRRAWVAVNPASLFASGTRAGAGAGVGAGAAQARRLIPGGA